MSQHSLAPQANQHPRKPTAHWFKPLFGWLVLLSFFILALGWWWNFSQAVTPGFKVTPHPQAGWVVSQLLQTKSPSKNKNTPNNPVQNIEVGTHFTHIQVGLENRPIPIQPEWLQGDMIVFSSNAQIRNAMYGERLLFQTREQNPKTATLLSPHIPNSTIHTVALRPLQWSEVGLDYLSFVVASFFVLSLGLLTLRLEPTDRASHIATIGSYVFAAACVVGTAALPRHWAIDPSILQMRLDVYSLLLRAYAFLVVLLLWTCPYVWRTKNKRFWQPYNMGACVPVLTAIILYSLWWVEHKQILDSIMLTKIAMYTTVCSAILLGLGYQIWRAWHNTDDNPYDTIVNRITLQWVAVGVVMTLILALYLRLSPTYGNAAARGAFHLFLRPETEVMTAMMLVKIVISALVLRLHLYKIQTLWWSTQGAAIAFCSYVAWLWFLRSVQPAWLTAINIVLFFLVAIVFYFIARLLYLSRRMAKEDLFLSNATAGLLHMASHQATPQIVQQQLVQLLQQQFHPQAVFRYPTPIPFEERMDKPPIEIKQAGALLQIQGAFDIVHLVGAQQGKRLFNRSDIESAFALWGLALQSTNVLAAIQKGEHIERKRIAADLHDNIGGRLLHLTAQQGHYGQRALDTLDDLRTLTRTMAGESTQLDELLADVRFAAASRCEDEDIDYRLHLEIDPDSPLSTYSHLPSTLVTNWLSIHNELLRNALRHAHASRIRCFLQLGARHVRCTFQDNGIANPEPESWQAGFGLPAIRKRAHQLHATVQWRTATTNGTPSGSICIIEWPIDAWAAGSLPTNSFV